MTYSGKQQKEKKKKKPTLSWLESSRKRKEGELKELIRGNSMCRKKGEIRIIISRWRMGAI